MIGIIGSLDETKINIILSCSCNEINEIANTSHVFRSLFHCYVLFSPLLKDLDRSCSRRERIDHRQCAIEEH